MRGESMKVGLSQKIWALKEKHPRELRAWKCVNSCFHLTDSYAAKTLKTLKRHEGMGTWESVRLHGRKKALKGKSHGRTWYEKRPGSSKRIKAPRGIEKTWRCIQLRVQAQREVAALSVDASKGVEPHERRNVCGFSFGDSWRFQVTGSSILRLGAFMIFEEDWKPKRGNRDKIYFSRHVKCLNTLWPSLKRIKGERGAWKR